MEEIFIHVDEQGNFKIEVKGVDGPSCKALTEDLERALGKVDHVVEKPEFRRANFHTRKLGQ